MGGGVGVAISSSQCSSSAVPFLGQQIVTKTSRGLIPHITRDHLDSIPVSCVEFPLEGLLDGDLFSSNSSLSLIKVLPEYREMKRFLSLRTGITCITKNAISFATSSGIKKISWTAFANAIKSLGINCLLAPIAPTFSESSKKATEKTIGLLNCLLSNLSIDIWAPIHDSLMEFPNYQQILLQKNQIIAGYWLEAGNKGLWLSKLPNENAQIYLTGCTSMAEMNAWSHKFLDRIFLENSYASMLTEEGSALTAEGKTICLWDSQFHADQKPICCKEDCPCFTCQKHSRCYLQHLLTVNEMLGWTLLAIHNETMLRGIMLKNKPAP